MGFNRRMVSLIFCIISLSAIFNARFATAAPIHIDISKWFHEAIPSRGYGIHGEIKCYGLPYGAIGFVSHVLTYYTLICIASNKRPLAPWKDLTHSWLDLALDIVALVGSTGISIFTMVRCQQTWQFLLMGVWKFTMAFSAGCVYTHRSILVRKHHRGDYRRVDASVKHAVSYSPLGWLIVYAGGVIVGMTGLVSLVSQNWGAEHVALITYVFGGVAGGTAFCVAIMAFIGAASDDGFSSGLKWSATSMIIMGIVAVGLLAAFYSDWILGAMTDNLIGSPSSENALLYWAYFVAKRLPILSL